MATQAYRNWVAAGRPFTLAVPVRQYRDAFRAAGWPANSLGTIGNEAHLQADTPQDHTPFSTTGWPGAHPYPYILAFDVSHGVSRETELDSIVAYWLSQARAGATPWVKYIIYKGHSWSVRSGWEQRNADNHYDHAHVSFRTDYVTTPVGVWPIIGKGNAMPSTDVGRSVWGETITSPALNYSQPAGEWLKYVVSGARDTAMGLAKLDALSAQVDELLARPQAAIDPVALGQALASNAGFVDAVASAVAQRVGSIPTPTQIAQAIGALKFRVEVE